MSLLEFMKYMAEHPDQLKAYRRDPEAFFQRLPDAERARIALSEEERRVLRSYPSNAEETTTVMRVMHDPLRQTDPASHVAGSAREDNRKSLAQHRVIVHAIADNDVFFAEPQDGNAGAVTLPHSYIYPDAEGAYFKLHLCYSDPNNELDRPQVLYISSERQGDIQSPNYAYKEVHIHIAQPADKHPGPGYILVLPRRETHTQLKEGSFYDPDNHELVLIFGGAQLPPSVESQIPKP